MSTKAKKRKICCFFLVDILKILAFSIADRLLCTITPCQCGAVVKSLNKTICLPSTNLYVPFFVMPTITH
jgi:hypothetical protein